MKQSEPFVRFEQWDDIQSDGKVGVGNEVDGPTIAFVRQRNKRAVKTVDVSFCGG